MSMEDERFRRRHSIGRKLHILYRWHRQYLDEELSHLGISSHLVPFMSALFHGDGITQEQLTARVHVDKATTTRSVRKLMRLGLVERKRDEEDRRAYRLFLTPKGASLKSSIRNALRGWTREVTEGLSEIEKGELRDLLDRMVANSPFEEEKEDG